MSVYITELRLYFFSGKGCGSRNNFGILDYFGNFLSILLVNYDGFLDLYFF